MRLKLLLFIVFCFAFIKISAQDFTTTASGDWTTGANWGGTAPPIVAHTGNTINVNHDMTISGDFQFGGNELIIASGASLTITGDFDFRYSTVTVNGTFDVQGTGTSMIPQAFNIAPGGTANFEGNVQIESNQLNVGTATAGPPNADLVVKGNLMSNNGGDVIVNQNGRTVIYGDFSGNSNGSTLITVNDGGQLFINGDVDFGSASDVVANNNASNTGVYVGGSVSGGSVSGTVGDVAALETESPTLETYVASLPGSPLPVTLAFFTIQPESDGQLLLWKSLSEVNNDFYSVEASNDGEYYEELTKIKGAGDSKVAIYYEYKIKFTGAYKYYRLKQTDFDGKFEYLGVVVSIANPFETTIYPNPVVQGNIITLQGEVSKWELVDYSGNVIKKGTGNELSSNVPKGVYVARIYRQNTTETHKVIVK